MVFDFARSTPASSLTTGAVSATTDELYVANEAGSMDVVNIKTGLLTTSVPLPAGGFGLAVTPDQVQIYVAQTGGFLTIINRATTTIVNMLTLGGMPRKVAFNAAGSGAIVQRVWLGGLHQVRLLPLGWCLAVGLPVVACGDSTGPGPGGSAPTHPAGVVDGNPVVLNTPFGIAITPSGRALVTRLFGDSVSSGSLPFSSFPSAIGTGLASIPTDVASIEGGANAYVANQNSQSIGILNLSQNVMTGSIPVGGDPFRVYAPPGGHRAYVSTNADSVFVINTSNNNIVGRIKVGPDPNGLALSPNGADLYVSHSSGSFLYKISTANNTITDSLEVGGQPQEVVVDPANTRVYIANEMLGLQVWDIAGDSLLLTLAIPAFGMALSPDGVQLYVSGPSTGQVRIIDRASLLPVGNPLNVGGVPRRIAFSKVGDYALIANEGNFVTVVK